MFNIAIIQKMQMKTTMRYHLTPIRIAIIRQEISSVGKDVAKKESACTAGMYPGKTTVKKYGGYLKH